MNIKIKALIAAASLVFAIGGVASSASAATPMRDHNAHRVMVSAQRMRAERRMHEMSAARLHRLHVATHRVRVEHRIIRHVG